MAKVDWHAPGTFCWAELATTDPESARRFYGALLHWTGEDRPMGPDRVYTMVRVRDRYAAALYGMDAAQLARGTAPHWLVYVCVANVDDSVRVAGDLGGAIIRPAADVMDAGRMAVVRDPMGAKFALWEPKGHTGAGVANEPGAPVWHELYTPDPDRARDFYGQLFGWTAETVDANGRPYTVFSRGDVQVAGMIQLAEEWTSMPTVWTVYFAVADCDGAAKQARRLGGRVTVEPADVPGVGRFALLRDPQGAAFSVIHMDS